MIVLADRANLVLPTEQVELLELLAMQAAAGLRMAAAVVALRERASRDPLTGLGHHGTFLAAVPAARAASQRRVALLMVDVDGVQDDQRHARPRRGRRRAARARRRSCRRPADGARSASAATSSRSSATSTTRARAERIGWELQTRRPRAARHDAVGRRRAGRAGRGRRRADRPRRRGALRGQAQRPRRRAAGRTGRRLDSAAVFGRIDHIGVAVEDLDAAIALHERAYGMEVVHRETVAEQGVEAVLLDVGENHVELLAPLGAGHAGRQVPGQEGARACTTSPTRWPTSTRRSASCAPPACA